MAGHTAAQGSVVPLTEGMGFQKARTSLHKAGWHTRTMHVKNQYTYIGTENTMRNHGVRGIESCAIDRPVCIINYKKGNACLRIFTLGEEFKDLRVDSWSLDCPSKDAL